MSQVPGRRQVAITAAAAAILVALALGTGAVIGSRTPSLDADELDSATLTGGTVLVTGVAHNTGAGVAHNVAVSASATLGPGLSGNVKLGDLAAGQSLPYEVRLPLAAGQMASADYTFSATSSMDEPALDIGDHSSAFNPSGGHVVVQETGTVKNMGSVPAPNVTLLWQNTSDQAGQNVLGKASQNLGDIPAGGQASFSLNVDLGASPPADIWYAYDFTYDAGAVTLEKQAARRLGGTLSFAGALRNRGSVGARDVSLSSALLDSAGKRLATGTTLVGPLAAGGRTRYTLTIDLGQASADDVHAVRVTLAWRQTLLFVVDQSMSRSSTATLPAA